MELRPPPTLEHADAGGSLVNLLPVLGSLGSIGLVASMVGTGPRQLLAMAVFVLASVAYVVAQLDRQRRLRARAARAARTDYLAYLATAREEVRRLAAGQRESALARHPPPAALPALAETGALPRAGPVVRYGVAAAPLATELVVPEATALADPFCLAAVRRLVDAHARLDLPATLSLDSARVLTAPAGVARALVCAVAAETFVVVLAAPARQPEWEWAKWLPHRAFSLRPATTGRPPTADRLLVVADGVSPPDIDAPVIVVGDRLSRDGEPLPGTPDDCPVAVAEALARRLTRAVASGDSIQPEPDWSPRPPGDRLRVPIGRVEDGGPVALDLKEPALGGVGPHGLVVGATGSGKSELLRTLVSRLALTHAPAELSLVLVDFKGGAAFDGLAALPHVSALVTNLEGEQALVARMEDALAGELVRRQEVLRATGATSATGRLPALLVVVDEFSELLAARPELAELFASIGRVGRSLGVHLLLATQRLDEGRLRGLESQLSYRICLRTFSAQESRAVLGSAAAFELPSVPGVGFLAVGPGEPVPFRADYADGPVARPPTVERVTPLVATDPVVDPATETDSFLQMAMTRLASLGPRAHQIWLPPLAEPPRLEELLASTTAAGDEAPEPHETPGGLPIGVIDRPRQQRRDPLVVDPFDGHLVVVGGPGSGKTTLLQTLIGAVALTRPPERARIYLLGDPPTEGLTDLPHLVAVAGREEPDLAERIVAEASRLIDSAAEPADTLLVVDDWGRLREERPDLAEQLVRIAGRGPARGVHLAVSASRWADLRGPLRDLLGTRLELRLTDPLDSELDRRAAAAIPRRSGRGITPDGEHFLAAPPPDDLLAQARAAWPGRQVPRLRRLPALVRLDDLPQGRRPVIGLAERDHRPVCLDGDHLLVLGDPGSGRTTLLRTLLRQLDGERVVVIDPRRTLPGDVARHHLHATDVHTAEAAVRAVVDLGELGRHGPGRHQGSEDRASEDRASRSGIHKPGADTWVLADDLDLVPALLQPLVPLLGRGRDLGLHLVVTRRVGGLGRMLYDPVIGTLRELLTPIVLLSGSPEEGPVLADVRPRPLPPGRGRLVDAGGVRDTIQIAVG
ncbi:FtsK/SpoIIIE domain-containing protein [Nocardioides sp.]|uniref:FtsK/SpoIIIE domain-containing protein n=1 Tax=Nocardioides sp. TaxID=35761 RepID=UPI0039E3D576